MEGLAPKTMVYSLSDQNHPMPCINRDEISAGHSTKPICIFVSVCCLFALLLLNENSAQQILLLQANLATDIAVPFLGVFLPEVMRIAGLSLHVAQ